MPPRDHALVEALRAGDKRAFGEFFERYADAMYRLAAGLLRDETEAEDVVQEAFVKVLSHLDDFRGEAQLNVWLYRIAYNACISRLRGKKKSAAASIDSQGELPAPRALDDWQETPEEILARAETRRLLDEAIAELPELLRAAFILRDIEGLSTAATAAALEISEAAAKVRLHRARLLLREKLSRHLGVHHG